jgi:hypothetical protein
MSKDWRIRIDRVLNDYPTEYFLLETWGACQALWNKLAPHIDVPLYRDEKAVLLTTEQVRRALMRLDAEASNGLPDRSTAAVTDWAIPVLSKR